MRGRQILFALLVPYAVWLVFAYEYHFLDGANLLYQVIGMFTDLDLHPEVVPNHNMGYVFEELIRRFAEQSNEGKRALAGEFG